MRGHRAKNKASLELELKHAKKGFEDIRARLLDTKERYSVEDVRRLKSWYASSEKKIKELEEQISEAAE